MDSTPSSPPPLPTTDSTGLALPTAPVPQPKPPTPVDLVPFDFVRKDRTLVLCFDGTGDQFDKDNSNVIELLSMLKKDDRTRQMVYYQSGIGTYTGRDNTASNLKAAISKTLDSAFAWNLKNHVKEGYTFLMQNYISGDRISLFGFSRGAYTARALAGMIHKVGLLPPGNEQQVPFAYNIFHRTDDDSWDTADIFKKAYCIDVRIDYIGVWDTVRSVGILDTSLPFSTSNNSIKFFRHAVSLDEHRTKFKANHWNPPNEEDQRKGTIYNKPDTDVKEVWFSGVHCDVGGGSVANGVVNSLAKISLRWMVKECFRCKTGILFKAKETFETTGLTPDLLTTSSLETHTSSDSSNLTSFSTISSGMTAVSEDEARVFESESKDAVQPIADQLVEKKWWWILEFLPLHQSIPGVSKKGLSIWQKIKLFFLEHPFNNGKGRAIPLKDTSGADVPLFVHHSVFERTQRVEEPGPGLLWLRKKQNYTPKAVNWKDVHKYIIWTD